MSRLIDTAGKVREGEALPEKALDSYLKTHLENLEGALEITQFAGGASNWTYRLKYANRDMILRRAPAGTKAKSAHDMGREYNLQKALKPAFPYVPEMLLYCEDTEVIGTDFYVMERLVGIIPRKNMPKGLDFEAEQVEVLCRNMLDRLIELHHVDLDATGLRSLAKGEGYAKRQIDGWSERYRKARTWNVPSGKGIMRWLQDNLPQKEEICLTHNDFRFDNLVLDVDEPTQILGVLDWELATLGDPLMDVGNMLAYWIQADDDAVARSTRRQPTHLPGMFTRQQVIEYYLEHSGFAQAGVDADDFTFYEVYGIFRLSAIAQQIYYRYHHKQTNNPAFKNFWFLVNYLHWRCRKLIKKHKK